MAFIRANKLQESQSLLDFKDRKMVGSFTYSDKGEVDFEKIDAVMREALLLDKTKNILLNKKPSEKLEGFIYHLTG